MNTNIDIENIFLHKDYHELSADEKLAIEDIANNEASFNDTKLMMSSIQNYLNDIPEISPKKESKDELIATFKKIRPAATEKTVGLGFLFPKDKAFFQKPGFQILAAAAVLVFIITIFNNTILTKNDTELAQNQNKVKEEEVKPSEAQITNINEEGENEENQNEESTNVTGITEKTEKSQLSQNTKIEENKIEKTKNETAEGTSDYYAEDMALTESKKSDFAEFGDEFLSSTNVIKDEIEELDDNIAINETTTLDNLSNIPSSNAMVAIASEESESKASMDKNASKKRLNNVNTPKLSKTLSENAELINLFYTAM